MKNKFEYLDHTSDIEFVARGKTLKEVFENAALAFYNSIVDLSRIDCKITKNVSVEGDDIENLLYNFLEELLFLFDTEKFLGKKVKVEKLIIDKGKNRIVASVCGEELNMEKHNPKTEIKAVTYHQMYVKKVDGVFEAHVILDI